MFNRLSFLALAGVLVLSACNSSSDSNTKTADSVSTQQTIGQDQSAHAGAHTYTCPMHPEVQSDKPGECPKCGMDLEHTDGAASTKTFGMGFTVAPANPVPGQAANLSLRPFDPDNKETEVPLDVEHEKKIHLIITSKDLAYFDHIHPEYLSSGNYDVKHTFPKADTYVLYADFKATGGAHATEKHEVKVGNGTAGKTEFNTEKLVSNIDGYEVALENQGTGSFNKGEAAHIAAVIQRDGKELAAESLEDYLGAKAHMVMIRQGSLDYLHVHPGIENGRLDLHTTFEEAGTYRGWLQFQTEGKVHTADFVVKIR